MAQTVPNKTHTLYETKVLNLFYIFWRFSFYTEKQNTKVKKIKMVGHPKNIWD